MSEVENDKALQQALKEFRNTPSRYAEAKYNANLPLNARTVRAVLMPKPEQSELFGAPVFDSREVDLPELLRQLEDKSRRIRSSTSSGK